LIINPKNKRIFSIAVGVFILALTGVITISKFNHPKPPPQSAFLEDQKRRSGPCPGPEETIEVNGKTYTYLPNWYACHPVERGDRVYFRFSNSLEPVVRTIYAIPGDHVELVKDSTLHHWNLKVGHDLVLDADHEPHFFGVKALPVLSLYLKEKMPVLKDKNYILFDDHSPSRADSGTLGVVNSDDFLGKIES